VRSGLRPIHLVDHDNGLEAVIEGLASHEAGLRHGTIDGVNNQQHGIDHGQDTLHLAAEIRVPRRVHDVDPVVAPADRRVL
jgi:hypothetical protein